MSDHFKRFLYTYVLERDTSPCESPSSRGSKCSSMLRSNSTTSFNQSPVNGMFSSPSMPNIAVAVRNLEAAKTSSPHLVKKPYYEDAGSLHTQRNPLLVQAIIANQIERINQNRINRANSVPTMSPEVDTSPLTHNQQLNQLNNLALLRLHQMTEEVNQMRSQSQNLAMTQNLSQLTLDSNGYPNPVGLKIVRSSCVRSWNTPFDKRTAIVHDECVQNDEIRVLSECVSKIVDTAQLDVIINRLASKEELRLVHSEKHVQSHLGISPLARMTEESNAEDIATTSSRRAAAAVTDLAQAVMTRQIANGFAFFRPGGSHAEKDRSDHQSHFNSIAIATKVLHEQYPHVRILIIDWDETHANGTQNVFYSDSSVLHISIHKTSISSNGKIDEVR